MHGDWLMYAGWGTALVASLWGLLVIGREVRRLAFRQVLYLHGLRPGDIIRAGDILGSAKQYRAVASTLVNAAGDAAVTVDDLEPFNIPFSQHRDHCQRCLVALDTFMLSRLFDKGRYLWERQHGLIYNP